MPNWTSNTIRVAGRETDIRAFLEAVKWQDEIFDFNRLIPMPPLLRHTSSGSHAFGDKSYDAWYVENPDADWKDRIERPFTPEEEAVLKDIGYSNWYDWSNANWGTKWNACNAEPTEGSAAEGYVEIRFDTAWGAPFPIFNAMFEMFPKLSFTCSWQDEDEELTHSIERESPDHAEINQ